MRKRNLKQVLRVRGLMEDLARAELETRAGLVRQLGEAAARQRGGALTMRREGWEELAKGEPGQHDSGRESAWLLGLAEAEILEGKSKRLRLRAAAEKPAVDTARETMLERRRERQQIETLVKTAKRAEEQERVRREQQQVDDWFQGRGRGRRVREES
ncbi:MAG TPA: hypothetical protein VHZ09_07630 [Acidobacteriaceae bacterium]|jgi:hypothetical protein|nr:hypothetical protein [Acidobacteriaceae bacterium]